MYGESNIVFSVLYIAYDDMNPTAIPFIAMMNSGSMIVTDSKADTSVTRVLLIKIFIDNRKGLKLSLAISLNLSNNCSEKNELSKLL